MSFDLSIQTVCDHRIYRELLTLDSDRRSLRFSRPLSAVGNVELFASDDLVSKTEYILVEDTTINDPYHGKMVYLKEKWSQIEDYFEFNYVTLHNYCPKCLGLKYLDDVNYDTRGGRKTVRNENLLLQNIEKFVITTVGSNPFHTFIGTSLVTFLGERNSNRDYIETKITHEINSTLGILKDMQQQYEKTGRAVTDGEMLDIINSVEVNFDVNDPTVIRADVTVQARSGKTVDYTQYMRVN